jgi:hypothetical protein
MKPLFENWRRFLKEGEVDKSAESILKWAEGDSGAKTKVAKPKTSEIEPDEYSSPYEHEETEDETREKYFGTGPDSIECVKDLRDPKKFINPLDFYSCMDDAGYEKIAAGSFRVAFTNPSNPDLVLKIVTPETMLENPALGGAGARKSMNMNRAEANASYQTASDLVPKVYDSAKDYFWIMSEKVTPITTWRETKTFFPAWSAEDQEDFNFYFHKLISEDRDEEDLINTLDNRIEYVKLGEELVNDPLILQIRDLLAQFDAPTWDIRPYNVGYATRDGKKQFVILDPGFELKKDAKSEFGPHTSSPEDSEAFSDLFKDKYAVTAPDKPKKETIEEKLAKLSENWQLFVEMAAKSTEDLPKDWFIKINSLQSVQGAGGISVELVEKDKEGDLQRIQGREDPWSAITAYKANPGTSECLGAYIVEGSSAPAGFGPLLYDIMMELAAESGLTPDRSLVSAPALHIWDYYLNNRDDIEKKQLDDADSPRTQPTEDDCDMSAAKYAENDEEWYNSSLSKVYYKNNTEIIDRLRGQNKVIEGSEVESPEKPQFIEPEPEPFEPEDFDWEELDYIEEQTEPYQRFSKSTYRIFINKLGKQGPNKYNVGARMKKPSSKHLKSGPPGG